MQHTYHFYKGNVHNVNEFWHSNPDKGFRPEVENIYEYLLAALLE